MLYRLKRSVLGPLKQGLQSAQRGFLITLSPIRKRLIFSRLAPVVPPEALMHDGPPTYLDFKRNAEEFPNLYVELCGLKTHERILDVGCGIGRKTILLTKYLDARGSYEGIHIVKNGIDWCSRARSQRSTRTSASSRSTSSTGTIIRPEESEPPPTISLSRRNRLTLWL